MSTVATTVDDGSLASSRSKTNHDRGRSPGPTSDADGSLRRSLSRSLSRSISRTSKSRSMSQDRDSDYTDVDDDYIQDLDRSDQDLAQQLELADELARRNSKSQNDRQVPVRSSQRKAAPIYEGESVSCVIKYFLIRCFFNRRASSPRSTFLSCFYGYS